MPALRQLKQLSRIKFLVKLIFIIGGALIGAVGGAMEGKLLYFPEIGGIMVTLKGVLVSIGALSTCGGAIFLLLVEDDMPSTLDAARDLALAAKEHITGRDNILSENEQLIRTADLIDKKRRSRLLAIEQMCDVVEAALLTEADTKTAADKLLKRAIDAIHKAVDFEGEDFFTVTIFKREDRGNGERMYPICNHCTDPVKGAMDTRDWAPGRGYTGTAWTRAKTNPTAAVIIGDTGVASVRVDYPVDHYDPVIEGFYRSVASIPILIGKSDDVWGVVTATSDRVGVFRKEAEKKWDQNVAVIREVAAFTALLASIDRRTHKNQTVTEARNPSLFQRLLRSRN